MAKSKEGAVPEKRGGTNSRTIRPKREDVRQRLLDAALDQFVATGYDKTSLDQIAESAGFSKGAIYSNFSSKEGLFLTLMDHQVRERIRVVQEMAGGQTAGGQTADASSEETVSHARPADIGRTLVGLIIQDSDWQLLFLEYVSRVARDPESLELFAKRRRNIRTVVATAAVEVLGLDHPIWSRFTPESIALVVLALSNGLAIERLADPDGVPDDLFGQLLDSLTP